MLNVAQTSGVRLRIARDIEPAHQAAERELRVGLRFQERVPDAA